MSLQAESSFLVLALLAVLLATAWWLRGRSIAQLRSRCQQLQDATEHKEAQLARTLARCDELQGELSGLYEKLGAEETRIEQLRDLVKVHVARRREYDEWANPIRASLGEAVGHTLRSLKEQMTQQEFNLQRQSRRVADAEAQFLRGRDELERMHRELTLKNYHIAALNERFIRVEERMQELSTEVAAMGVSGAVVEVKGGASAGNMPLPGSAAASPETERFSLDKPGARDWMEMLDDWHRQLHDRLDGMDQMQARLRAGGARGAGGAGASRRDGDGQP
jgi:predicted  nucleic acid-binding Zn-ribbon protein